LPGHNTQRRNQHFFFSFACLLPAHQLIWTEWRIDLKEFADQGVNLANIDSIAIGVGTKGNTMTHGGFGTMYFDDIRLYRPKSAP
jgi:hypothetical protein